MIRSLRDTFRVSPDRNVAIRHTPPSRTKNTPGFATALPEVGVLPRPQLEPNGRDEYHFIHAVNMRRISELRRWVRLHR